MLARAIADRQPERARELAQPARTGLAAGGVDAKKLAEVEAWLRTHGQ